MDENDFVVFIGGIAVAVVLWVLWMLWQGGLV